MVAILRIISIITRALSQISVSVPPIVKVYVSEVVGSLLWLVTARVILGDISKVLLLVLRHRLEVITWVDALINTLHIKNPNHEKGKGRINAAKAIHTTINPAESISI